MARSGNKKYHRGAPQGSVQITGETDKTGTIVTFKPDTDIFLTTTYKYEILSARLRELAFLNAGIRLILIDKRDVDEEGNVKTESFFSEEGLKEFVEYLDSSREKLS